VALHELRHQAMMEEWTLSVAHEPENADAFVAVFEELASDLTA
jgi:hypothetical protein